MWVENSPSPLCCCLFCCSSPPFGGRPGAGEAHSADWVELGSFISSSLTCLSVESLLQQLLKLLCVLLFNKSEFKRSVEYIELIQLQPKATTFNPRAVIAGPWCTSVPQTNHPLALPPSDPSRDLSCLWKREGREDVVVKRNLLGFSLARVPVILCQLSRVHDL